GFYVAPMLLGGTKESLSIVAALVVSQYLLKLVIAVVDTPLVYGVVDVLGSEEERRRSVPNS
ncbi:MAG: VUT family protein, partial [Halobacteria archaeon]|nr:VUT family protein [Halobacteria archaeon]